MGVYCSVLAERIQKYLYEDSSGKILKPQPQARHCANGGEAQINKGHEDLAEDIGDQQQNDDEQPVTAYFHILRVQAPGEKTAKDVATVQGRDGQQVEPGQGAVDADAHAQRLTDQLRCAIGVDHACVAQIDN